MQNKENRKTDDVVKDAQTFEGLQHELNFEGIHADILFKDEKKKKRNLIAEIYFRTFFFTRTYLLSFSMNIFICPMCVCFAA